MTSRLDSHRKADIKPEMLSGVQMELHMNKYVIRGIAHACTNRKDDIFMQRRLVQNFTFMLELGQETCSLTKHTWRWIYSALWYFIPACCLVRFAAFLTSESSFYKSQLSVSQSVYQKVETFKNVPIILKLLRCFKGVS